MNFSTYRFSVQGLSLITLADARSEHKNKELSTQSILCSKTCGIGESKQYSLSSTVWKAYVEFFYWYFESVGTLGAANEDVEEGSRWFNSGVS